MTDVELYDEIEDRIARLERDTAEERLKLRRFKRELGVLELRLPGETGAARAAVARQCDKARAAITASEQALAKLYPELSDARTELKDLNLKFSSADKSYEVSDHALVRWLERVHNVDVATLRKLATEWVIENGFAVIVPQGESSDKIVTVIRGRKFRKVTANAA